MFAKLGALGLMGVCWPVEYGGAAMSTLDWAIVMEELARVDAGVALSLAAHHSLCSGHIHLAGSEAQKKKKSRNSRSAKCARSSPIHKLGGGSRRKPARSKGAVDLGSLQDEEEKKAIEAAAEAFKPVQEKLKAALKGRAKDVRVTTRLVDSPAVWSLKKAT